MVPAVTSWMRAGRCSWMNTASAQNPTETNIGESKPSLDGLHLRPINSCKASHLQFLRFRHPRLPNFRVFRVFVWQNSHTPDFHAESPTEKIRIFFAFTWRGRNGQMQNIRPTSLILTGIWCNRLEQKNDESLHDLVGKRSARHCWLLDRDIA